MESAEDSITNGDIHTDTTDTNTNKPDSGIEAVTLDEHNTKKPEGRDVDVPKEVITTSEDIQNENEIDKSIPGIDQVFSLGNNEPKSNTKAADSCTKHEAMEKHINDGENRTGKEVVSDDISKNNLNEQKQNSNSNNKVSLDIQNVDDDEDNKENHQLSTKYEGIADAIEVIPTGYKC